MGIGTSKGAFYRDESHYQASQWDDRYDDNVIEPNTFQRKQKTEQQLYEAETGPFGMGMEVSNKLVPPNKMGITDEDIDTAINVGMGGGPGTIAGVGSKMAASATGWFKGFDGKMRYEISDLGMKLKEGPRKAEGTLGELIEHPEFFKAYPEAANIPFKSDEKSLYLGMYSSAANKITYNPLNIKAGDEGFLDILVHELQHFIQKKEGFAKGTNPNYALGHALTQLAKKAGEATGKARDDILDLVQDIRNNANAFADYLYLRAPGEVEANVVMARRKLSDEMRQKFSVEDTKNILEGSTDIYGVKYHKELNIPYGLADASALERVGRAALKYGDEIFVGVNHGDAFSKLEKAVKDFDYNKVKDGFISTEGKFLTRQEATAVAEKARQIKKGEGTNSGLGLVSEDLTR